MGRFPDWTGPLPIKAVRLGERSPYTRPDNTDSGEDVW
jgi:hypothetical protein